jgi:glycogen debranching enzyme
MTAIGEFAIAFHNDDTLLVASPSGTQAGIRLRISNAHGEVERDGGNIRGLRSFTYQSRAHVIHNEMRGRDGDLWLDYLVDAHPENAIELSFSEGSNQQIELPPFSRILQNSEQRWHSWFDRAPQTSVVPPSKYYYAWWVIGNNLVSPRGHLRYQAMMPCKGHYVGIWNWDSAFHALGIRHLDPDLARDQLRTILDNQLDNGMLPDVVYDEGTVERIDHPIPGAVTKPPIMAWAAIKLHETDPNTEFLSAIYPSLKRWNGWWLKGKSTSARGMAQYEHPYSSGQDDSPLWDHGMPVLSPDLNSYLSVQMSSLASIADHLKLHDESAYWNREAGSMVKRMVRNSYDPESGFFWAQHGSYRIPERTLMNLLPLWTGRLTSDIENRLIENLFDPQFFWAPFPLSTVARDSQSYDPETMWRGPAWVNMNYIFIEALINSGRQKLAKTLRKRTLEHISEQPGLFEYYNPETGKPATQAVPMFGWTAALFIDLAVQSTIDEGCQRQNN